VTGKFFVCLLLGVLAASANTIIMPIEIDYTRGGNLRFSEDGTAVNGLAGVILIQLTEDNGSVYNRDTLCVDLFTNIYLGQNYETTVLRPDEVPGKNLPRVSWLVDNALLPTQVGGIVSHLPDTAFVRTPEQGMGIQLAIWDIVHDNGDGFGMDPALPGYDPNVGGRVRAVYGVNGTNATTLAWAQYYLAQSFGMRSDLAFVYQNVHMGTTDQAQMLAGPLFEDGGPKPTPEPMTLVMVGLALVGMGVFSRRIRGRAA
jgi:hypothetical protein